MMSNFPDASNSDLSSSGKPVNTLENNNVEKNTNKPKLEHKEDSEDYDDFETNENTTDKQANSKNLKNSKK